MYLVFFFSFFFRILHLILYHCLYFISNVQQTSAKKHLHDDIKRQKIKYKKNHKIKSNLCHRNLKNKRRGPKYLQSENLQKLNQGSYANDMKYKQTDFG